MMMSLEYESGRDTEIESVGIFHRGRLIGLAAVVGRQFYVKD